MKTLQQRLTAARQEIKDNKLNEHYYKQAEAQLGREFMDAYYAKRRRELYGENYDHNK